MVNVYGDKKRGLIINVKESLARNVCIFILRINQSDCSFQTFVKQLLTMQSRGMQADSASTNQITLFGMRPTPDRQPYHSHLIGPSLVGIQKIIGANLKKIDKVDFCRRHTYIQTYQSNLIGPSLMWVENVENLLTLSDLRGLEFFSANLRVLTLPHLI